MRLIRHEGTEILAGGWARQAFAFASSNDSGGKKLRIRRSKEERKIMVESFITKYQKSNDGNFPSLNLTHKEVGGSFYTVREIVREIIQENRVLAPAKVFLEEDNHSGFPEQCPLESVSVEPQNNLLVSDKLHIATALAPGITGEQLSSALGLQFLGWDARELHHEQVINGLSTAETGKESDSASHPVPQAKCDEFENQKIVNGGEGLEENVESDKALIMNSVPIRHQDNKNESALQSSQKTYAVRSWRSTDEQYLNTNGQMVDKTKESRRKIYTESVDMEMLDRERDGVKELEVLQQVTSHMSTNFVVETFPLRPVSRTILVLDGDSGKCRGSGTLDDRANKHDNMTFSKSNSGLVNEKDEERLLGSTLELNDKYRDKKVGLNHQEPSFENSKLSTNFSINDVDNVKDSEPESSLPDEIKASPSAERLISEDSNLVSTKCSSPDETGLKKRSNPVLDRRNLDTSEGAKKKSATPESNNLLTFVKAFISAFIKLWTE
ncbi:hypothetical protein Sango_0768700 [Sesamum angolense]|uniref:AT3G52170-like helix-turn-helix domain-containing protein n=1 Tax=Sesamum angolense TaxID=2727404 RepID=A0AAE2C007_9LAMI|nr:hypothetical protein Sango_0768700 [Sesamum angolense]